MYALFELLQWWHWWILATLFFIFEILAPTVFFLWLGFAAIAVGAIVLIFPGMTWELQLLAFALLSVISVIAGRTWFKRNPIETDQPVLNERGKELIGQVVRVEDAIVNGTGRVHVGDTTWKANGPDTPAGEKVRIVGVDAAVLRVEHVD